jgi:integrase
MWSAGPVVPPTTLTLNEAVTAWLDGARSGVITNRSGDPYKPSAIRGYRDALDARVLPELGRRRLSEVTFLDLQDLVERLAAEKRPGGAKWSPSTVQGAITPLRAIFARALARGEVAVNPTTGLKLPAVRGGRDHIVSPGEAARLLAALPEGDRALWATALYAGLRRGELQALRWHDVDLTANVIHVAHGRDRCEGETLPKSRKGVRTVPVARVLREHLLRHRLRTVGDGLVFGRTPGTPFAPQAVADRADAAWRRAGLTRITLHECRHTFASLMIAAGANVKAISVYMGHANIAITLDKYGHLMPGNEDEAGALLDGYLERAAAAGDAR